jgi:hypothetical protein
MIESGERIESCEQFIQQRHQLLCTTLRCQHCETANVRKEYADIFMFANVDLVKHCLLWQTRDVRLHFRRYMPWQDGQK